MPRNAAATKDDREKPLGRPSEYKPRLHPRIAARAAAVGMTDQEIADLIGVDRTTILNWKMAHPAFLSAIKTGREPADDRVERALYDQAMAGNVTAQIFWLKNRRPQDWRDRREVEMSHDYRGLQSVEDIMAAVTKELGAAMARRLVEGDTTKLLELTAEPVPSEPER